MQDLPVELQERVLLSLKQPEDLYRACSTSRANFGICSGSVFWRAKFAREGLPLLEEGNNFATWLKIYAESVSSAEIADELISSRDQLLISIKDIPDLSLLQIPGYEKQLETLWREMQTGANRFASVGLLRSFDEPVDFI
ncbi:F-box domain-containing protein [Cedratvirus Zaza IHUMI]|uniref:F-box domain-containing protein n=1 Tax=Cedratvirus Zaza IHUMI TaxID=2126979 RepID=A0A2R8FEB7_9VIRU|nr:F-box domain-containing protein [Cedratvirus Zaza IHUMI]